jgi:hypothetical protein
MNWKENIFKRKAVQKALKNALMADTDPIVISDGRLDGRGSEVSMLIHDIFGGEILKTHKQKGWYFYNRVDGERFYFTGSNTSKSYDDGSFEDISSSPAETAGYFDQEDYSAFYVRFIRAFEETLGLGNNRKHKPVNV